MKAGWQKRTIGDLADVIAGQSPDGAFYNTKGDGLPFYQGKKEFSEKFIGEPTTWTTQVTRIAVKGDVLMSVRAPVGPVNFASGKMCIGRGLAAIRSKSQLDRDFLFFFLLSKQDEIQGTEGAVFASINKAQIEKLEIAIPPLPEQQRIVGILDEAFDGIATAKANAEKNRQNARALFESYLEAVFTQRGEGWVEKRLGDLADSISTGPFGTMVHKSDYVADGIPMVNPMNIIGSRIVPSDRMRVSNETRDRLSRYVLREGDIVIGRRGEMGRCALVTETEAGWLCGTGSFFLRLPENLDGKFFVALFSSESFRKRLEENSVGTTMSNLNHSILESLPILLPPLATQRAIMECVDEIEENVQRLESIYQQKLTALDALKKSLLHQAFSGQL